MFDEILKTLCQKNNYLMENMENDENSTNLIISNTPSNVFKCLENKQQFEDLFQPYHPLHFVYLPSFKRVRISFTNSQDSHKALNDLQGANICNQRIKIFCLKTLPVKGASFLHPPIPEKQFLISPPSSPPVNWQPIKEQQPCLNFDLITAVAELAPGTRHELQKATRSTPSVVVDICEDMPSKSGLKIPQTRRPDLK